MPDEVTPYGTAKLGRKERKVLSPEEAAKRITRLIAARPDRGKMEAERVAAILHSPTDNLAKFKRLEWEIIGLHLGDPRLDAKQLSKIVGYRHESVFRVLRSAHVQKMIAEIRAQQVAAMIRGDFGAAATLKAAQGKAAKKIVETMETEDAKLGFTAAESVLDRTGLGKQSAVQHQHVHTLLSALSPAEMDHYAKTGQPPERLRDAFPALAPPIDVTPG